jgi:HMP-PP phosphatase
MARLAAFDMDGTLLMPDHRMGEVTRRTLERLRERDVILTFATGRHLLEMRHIASELLNGAFLITGNGTRVHDIHGERLWGNDLAPDVAERILHGHWKTRASMHVFNDSGWMTQSDIPELLKAHVYSGFRYRLVDLKRLPAHEVTKISFCGDHDDLVQLRIQLNDALGERAHLCFSSVDCLEILPHGCNKGAALAMLGAHLDVPLAECMAFGDAMNDREMLGAVGHGVIMGNAMPQLRQALPHLPVIGHCAREGVAHYLTHWLDTPLLSYSPER